MSGTHERKRPKGADARAQAEDWFVRISSDTFTAEEFAAWEHWLSRDESHRCEFERVERIWARIGQVRAIPWPTAEELQNDTYDGEMPVAQWLSAQSASHSVAAHTPEPVQAQLADQLEAQLDAPLEDQLAYPLEDQLEEVRARRRGWVWSGAIAAGVAAAALTMWWRGEFLEPAPGPDYRIATGVGEHHELTLPDGSKVVVGASSQLSVDYSRQARSLHLSSGEAYFAVAKDPARPFVVHAGPGTITAIGTEFDVKQIGAKVAVTVVEGTVEVGPRSRDRGEAEGTAARTATFETKRVAAGQSMNYGDGAGVTVEKTAAREAKAARMWWRDGNLRYTSRRLDEVIPDVQRYSTRRLVLADARATSVPFTGNVEQRGVENWLEQLGESLPVEVDTSDEQAIVIHAREP